MKTLDQPPKMADARRSLFIQCLGILILAVICLAGCSTDAAAPPEVIDLWEPPQGSETAPPLSCDDIGSLFTYDPLAPLDVQEVNRRREEGVTVIDLTYASPVGGRVPATLVLPDGAGPFAGILYQHGMPSVRQSLIPGAVTYARMGAVVLLIDAPFNRPEHGSESSLQFTQTDRQEQIQIIIDLRRGVDLLISRPEVDPQRLAYVGISYGGAMGGLLAGVEHRLKGYVLQVGDGGLVTHMTGPEDDLWRRENPINTQKQWIAWMWPIEPIHYVKCAAPAKLLFQNGTQDEMVPPADALRYQQAGSEPKTILWYQSGHGLGAAAGKDQAEWLSKVIGIASRRFIPPGMEISLTVWFLFTALCMIYLVVHFWRTRQTPLGACLMWLLSVLFLGPVGLVIHWISTGQILQTRDPNRRPSPVRQALGSAAWAAAGNALGGIGVMALLLYIQDIFGKYLILQIMVTLLLPIIVGWLVFATSKWITRSNDQYKHTYSRSLLTEVVSTCLVLVGLYPTVNILNGIWLNRWTIPFGYDLTYPPLWFVLCLGAIAGTLVAYPFHLWMIRRGEIHWGAVAVPDEHVVRRLPWYIKLLILVASGMVMLAAIFLSMQIAG
jgi:uncharacterized protein